MPNNLKDPIESSIQNNLILPMKYQFNNYEEKLSDLNKKVDTLVGKYEKPKICLYLLLILNVLLSLLILATIYHPFIKTLH